MASGASSKGYMKSKGPEVAQSTTSGQQVPDGQGLCSSSEMQEVKDDAISAEDLAEADKAEAEGCRDILEAAKENKVGAIRHFIRSDVNSVQKTDEEGETPLHLAALNGHDAVAERLLEAKAAVDAQSNSGNTPLHLAAREGHDAVAERLLEAKAAVDAQSISGQTPLHLAAREGHDAVVARLLEAEAAVDAQNKWGRTPYDLAKERGHQKVMGLLHPVFISLLSGRTCRCIYSQERSIKELKEEAEQKLGETIQHLIGSNMEPLTESKRLEEANVLPNSAITAIIAAAENFHYYEVVFKADDDLNGLRFEWEPPILIDLPNCAAVDTELQVSDALIEVNDVDVTELKQGEIEPMFRARPLKLAFRRKCEEPAERDDDLQDPKEFIEFLISANIRLVRLEFLLELHEDGRALPRRQEAETMRTRNGDTALVELHEYKKLHVNDVTGRVSMPMTTAMPPVHFCAVSHMWESMEHPDPWRFQLAQLAEKFSKCIGNGLNWVFLDYVSLFQFRRTPVEDQWFYKALDRMHLIYSHEVVDVTFLVDLTPEHLKSAREVLAFSEAESLVVLMSIAMLRLNSTPYRLRGWCQAERQWAFLRGLLLAGCVPLSPEAFRQLMEGMRFTHRDDGSAVFKLQEKVFKMKTATTTHLQLDKLDRVALDHLRESLPYYTRLTDIAVSGTPLANEDAIALLRSGASNIQMENCGLHDAAEIIAETLLDQTTRALKQLNLRRNRIADLGPLLDVMQQRPGLLIEMTPQSLSEAGEAESAVSAECSARGSE